MSKKIATPFVITEIDIETRLSFDFEFKVNGKDIGGYYTNNGYDTEWEITDGEENLTDEERELVGDHLWSIGEDKAFNQEKFDKVESIAVIVFNGLLEMNENRFHALWYGKDNHKKYRLWVDARVRETGIDADDEILCEVRSRVYDFIGDHPVVKRKIKEEQAKREEENKLKQIEIDRAVVGINDKGEHLFTSYALANFGSWEINKCIEAYNRKIEEKKNEAKLAKKAKKVA